MQTFKHVVEIVGLTIDAIGVAVIVVGLLVAALRYLTRDRRTTDAYRRFRRDLGRGILLGLELLVAADIIRTVALTPTIQSVTVLAIIVLIRTFLSMALQVEVDGRWPWQRAHEPLREPAREAEAPR